VQQALSRHRELLEARNPTLYRDLALYLQVLRDGLLNAVQQACFHLATRLLPDRYCALTAEQRGELQQVLIDLVHRAGHLITVEQLALLAGEMARERLQQRLSRQREWLAQLRKLSDEGGNDRGEGDPPAFSDDEPGAAPQSEVRSIDLELQPPLQPQLWGGGRVAPLARLELNALGGEMGWPGADRPEDLSAAADGSGAEPLPDQGVLDSDLAGSDAADTAAEAGAAGDAADRAATALMALLEGELAGDGEGLLASLLEATPTPGDQPPPPPWDQPALPVDPVLLLVWLDGFERALERRLRNLSHAINAEFLRLGLSQSLLPLNLLEGALRGHVEQQQAPANLLRLQLPLASDGAARLEAVALLLRNADLELERPALRQCRSRLRNHRLEVRKMADQHRRLQRRLQTLEAERLWLQDIPRTPLDRPSPDQPPPL
jgi:hypothetical protein